MRKAMLTMTIGLSLAGTFGASPLMAETSTLHPIKIPSGQMPSAIFATPQASVKSKGGVTRSDVISLHSKDKKFMSGVYKVVGKHSFDTSAEGYPVDEFMYFTEGGVTLTSADGTVTQVNAGDAVSIAKGWKGRWDSDGYAKYYVIYNPDGPAE